MLTEEHNVKLSETLLDDILVKVVLCRYVHSLHLDRGASFQESLASHVLVKVLETRGDFLDEEMAASLVVERSFGVGERVLKGHKCLNLASSGV